MVAVLVILFCVGIVIFLRPKGFVFSKSAVGPRAQGNPNAGIKITEYMDFIKKFTEGTNIMSKSFFIVVPYNPPVIDVEKKLFGTLPNVTKKQRDPQDRTHDFEESRTQLQQRVAVVEQGLLRSGVRMVQLGTEEVVELLYKLFNPGELEKPMPLELHG